MAINIEIRNALPLVRGRERFGGAKNCEDGCDACCNSDSSGCSCDDGYMINKAKKMSAPQELVRRGK